VDRYPLSCISIKYIFLLLVLIVLLGCGSKTMVVLVPDTDGKTGAITVSNSAGSVDIATANQATTISGGQQSPPSTPILLEQKDINTVFSRALTAQPIPPVHFILYFISDSNELNSDSFKNVPAIIQAIEKRNSVDISIIGHTDTVGNDEYNYTLSKGRADAVACLLMNRGVLQNHITTTSHGEDNPLIQTGDNISEPKNRRVEVVVR